MNKFSIVYLLQQQTKIEKQQRGILQTKAASVSFFGFDNFYELFVFMNSLL